MAAALLLSTGYPVKRNVLPFLGHANPRNNPIQPRNLPVLIDDVALGNQLIEQRRDVRRGAIPIMSVGP